MNFNHNELCTIETVVSRAVIALKMFADGSDKKALNDALYILAEIRNASQYLCDQSAEPHVRDQVAQRLFDLFKTN